MWEYVGRVADTTALGNTELMCLRGTRGVSAEGMGVQSLVMMRVLSCLDIATGLGVVVGLIAALLWAILEPPVAYEF